MAQGESAVDHTTVSRLFKKGESAVDLSTVSRLFKKGEMTVNHSTVTRCLKKNESAVDHSIVSRWFKNVCTSCKILNNQPRSGSPKKQDSEAVLQAIDANTVSSRHQCGLSTS